MRVIEPTGAAVALRIGADVASFAAAIVAVGPHQLATTVGGAAAIEEAWRAPLALVGAFAYESITTVYSGLPDASPFGVPLLRLDDAPGQWAVRPERGAGRRSADGTRRA